MIRPGRRHRLAVRVVNPLNSLDEYPAFSVEQLTMAEELEPDLPLLEAPAGKQTWYSSHSGLWQSVTLERTHAVALDGVEVRADPFTGAVDIGWRLAGGRCGGHGQRDPGRHRRWRGTRRGDRAIAG